MGRGSGLLFSVFAFVFFLVGYEHGRVFMINNISSFYGFVFGELCVVYLCCVVVLVWTSIKDGTSVELKYHKLFDCEAIKYFWRFFLCLAVILQCCNVCIELKG
jgi:hypothetical protein